MNKLPKIALGAWAWENDGTFGNAQGVKELNADDWTFDALETHYKTLVRYINLQDQGMVLGYGCGTPSMTKHSRYPEEAYRLGKNIK